MVRVDVARSRRRRRRDRCRLRSAGAPRFPRHRPVLRRVLRTSPNCPPTPRSDSRRGSVGSTSSTRFFLLFIVRSGLQIRSKARPPAVVTRTVAVEPGTSPAATQPARVVAPRDRHRLGAQRGRLCRAARRIRSVDAHRAAGLGRRAQRDLGRRAVRGLRLADPQRVGPLQRACSCSPTSRPCSSPGRSPSRPVCGSRPRGRRHVGGASSMRSSPRAPPASCTSGCSSTSSCSRSRTWPWSSSPGRCATSTTCTRVATTTPGSGLPCGRCRSS